VIPKLIPAGRFRAVLEVAPLAPFSGELRELTLTHDGRRVLRRAVPVEATETSASVLCRIAAPLRPAGETVDIPLHLRWRRLHAPGLQVAGRLSDIALLEFEPRAELQFREFHFDSAALDDSRSIIFKPNLSFSPADIGDERETRTLSFRFFRMTIEPV
jgi:hypothetical protein